MLTTPAALTRCLPRVMHEGRGASMGSGYRRSLRGETRVDPSMVIPQEVVPGADGGPCWLTLTALCTPGSTPPAAYSPPATRVPSQSWHCNGTGGGRRVGCTTAAAPLKRVPRS